MLAFSLDKAFADLINMIFVKKKYILLFNLCEINCTFAQVL